MRAIGAVLLMLACLDAAATPGHERAALQREIAAAVEARDWCRALHYTERLEELGHEARLVFNAAELARAAGDLVTARAYYREVADSDPGYAKAPLARQAIEEVGAQIATSGAGTRCAPSLPRCGDGAVEGREVCDDGNTASGDACTADCTRAPRCGDNVLDAHEVCDDGNLVAGDHCSPQCLPELAGTPRAPAPSAPEGPKAPPPAVVVHAPLEPAPVVAGSLAPGSDAPAPSGSAVLAAGLIGGGVIGSTAGAVCAIIGPLPLVRFLWASSALDEAAARARTAANADRYLREVRGSGAVDRDLRADVEQWNGTGRILTTAGVLLLALGAGGIVGGALLSGGENEGAAPPPPELPP